MKTTEVSGEPYGCCSINVRDHRAEVGPSLWRLIWEMSECVPAALQHRGHRQD